MTNSQFSWSDLVFRLLSVKGIGESFVNRMIMSENLCGSAVEAEKFIVTKLSQTQKEDYYLGSNIDLSACKQNNVKFISVKDPEYPVCLINYLNLKTPSVLSCMGNLNLLNGKKVGFSGSRKVSPKGMDVTRDCVTQLAESGISIVSGYANGVDLTAHAAALAAGGSTIMVLPQGIDHFLIRRDLKTVWDWNKVLVISEFLPSDQWTVGRAMKRNNTILGLSDVMVVIEAGTSGGSLDAGKKAIAGGKSLFVPQYVEWPESALGNPDLLAHGAFPIRRRGASPNANLTQLHKALATNASLFG